MSGQTFVGSHTFCVRETRPAPTRLGQPCPLPWKATSRCTPGPRPFVPLRQRKRTRKETERGDTNSPCCFLDARTPGLTPSLGNVPLGCALRAGLATETSWDAHPGRWLNSGRDELRIKHLKKASVNRPNPSPASDPTSGRIDRLYFPRVCVPPGRSGPLLFLLFPAEAALQRCSRGTPAAARPSLSSPDPVACLLQGLEGLGPVPDRPGRRHPSPRAAP